MDQDRAKKLFDYGATFVFLDVPEGTEFGMDCNVWTVGPKFKGVKMIPPGLHFIHFSPVSRAPGGDVGHRSGFFYDFKAEEVVVRAWNKKEETLLLAEGQSLFENASSPSIDSSGKKELDPCLAPYPYDNHKKWISLTSHARFELARALSPESGLISSFSELVADEAFCQKNLHRKNKMETEDDGKTVDGSCRGDVPSAPSSKDLAEARLDDDVVGDPEERLPKMTSVAGTPMRFHAIPKNPSIPRGTPPAEVTRLSIDKMPLFREILSRDFDGVESDLLGELQLAFVVFVFGRLFDGFEQWKRMTHLLCCSAASAAARHPRLYAEFITTLFFQTREIPEDFFVDIVTCDNFLTSTLCSLFVNIAHADIDDADLRTKAAKFKMYLTKKFKWNFDEEDLEDEKPVVVELTENQLKMIQ